MSSKNVSVLRNLRKLIFHENNFLKHFFKIFQENLFLQIAFTYKFCEDLFLQDSLGWGINRGWVGGAGYLILLKEYLLGFNFWQLRLTLNMIGRCESPADALWYHEKLLPMLLSQWYRNLPFNILIWFRGFNLKENCCFTWIANLFMNIIFYNVKNDRQTTDLKLSVRHMTKFLTVFFPGILFQFARLRASVNDRRDKFILLNKSRTCILREYRI